MERINIFIKKELLVIEEIILSKYKCKKTENNSNFVVLPL